jgi:citrate synthase
MMDHLSEEEYKVFYLLLTWHKPSPVLAKALDILFILHADHELNCIL